MKTKDRVTLLVMPFAVMAAALLLVVCGVVLKDILAGMMPPDIAGFLAGFCVTLGLVATGIHAINRSDEGWR